MHITPTSERAGAVRKKVRKSAILPNPELRNAPVLAPQKAQQKRGSHGTVRRLSLHPGDRTERRIRQAAEALPEMLRVAQKVHRGVAVETAVLDAWRALAGISRWTAGMVRAVEALI